MDGSTLEVHNCTERCVQSEERCNPTGPAPCRHKLARKPVNKTVNKTALRMLVHLRQKSMSYSRSDWSAKSSEHVGQQADQTDLPLISMQSRKADQTDLPTITTSHHTFLVINKKMNMSGKQWVLCTLEVHNGTERWLLSEECWKQTGPARCQHKFATKTVNKTVKKRHAHVGALASKRHVEQQIRLIC